MKILRLILSFSLLYASLVSCSSHNHRDMNAKFMKSDLDVDGWIKRFESTDREVFKYRNEIVKAMNLQKGMVVADIGAGTGAYLKILSESVTDKNLVSSRGRVYGVDVSPKFVEFMRQRAIKEKYKGVEVILGEFEKTTLPIESVDVIFMSDTYHHFENPEKMLANLNLTLKPDGRMFIIDFNKNSPELSEFLKKHIVNSKEDYISQIEDNGFEYIKTHNVPLKQNFMIEFKVRK